MWRIHVAKIGQKSKAEWSQKNPQKLGKNSGLPWLRGASDEFASLLIQVIRRKSRQFSVFHEAARLIRLKNTLNWNVNNGATYATSAMSRNLSHLRNLHKIALFWRHRYLFKNKLAKDRKSTIFIFLISIFKPILIFVLWFTIYLAQKRRRTLA